MRSDPSIERSGSGPVRDRVDAAIAEHESEARRAADIGDVSHAVFHGQAALVLALQHLTAEVHALRLERLDQDARS